MIKEDIIPDVVKQMTSELKNFTDIATLGMSGGADSTLVAILCKLALGEDKVYGYGLPFDEKDELTFNHRSRSIANELGIHYSTVSIAEAVDSVADSIYVEVNDDISPLNLGNIKSRMRMVMIYSLNAAVAERSKGKHRVIGTGNRSEDFIGYDTKGGDSLADIFPIGELYKSEVYQLLDYFIERSIITDEMIDRVPSAGLEPGQTDEGDLDFTYNEMEPDIEFCLANYNLMGSIVKIPIMEYVWQRHITHRHKHAAPRVIKLKKG